MGNEPEVIQAFNTDRFHLALPELCGIIRRRIQRRVKSFFSFCTCSMSETRPLFGLRRPRGRYISDLECSMVSAQNAQIHCFYSPTRLGFWLRLLLHSLQSQERAHADLLAAQNLYYQRDRLW